MQAKPRAIVPHFLSFRRLLRNLGFPFLPSPPPSRFLFSPEGKKFEATLCRSLLEDRSTLSKLSSPFFRLEEHGRNLERMFSGRNLDEKLGEGVEGVPRKLVSMNHTGNGNPLLRNNGRNKNEARVRSLVTIMFAALLYTGMVKSKGREPSEALHARLTPPRCN